ncbi:RNA-directed DNA polymerase [Galbibacter sp. EGI 63066]|uniref:RNA-directed DNA polymerase n=1 Tax=Galbibacter sp. EGI 63066 TaxID=2993559 RepID=UPI0022488179|nr:RNA-directed DNA polymerase [Galbibacter sp. EGI 63066]MCX2680936.1 RNA-directed DNA polymerase [Galbibacter sp. EGI 63066]
MKTLLELTHTEARDYFLKKENYSDIDLPKYYNFQPLLDALSNDSNVDNIPLDKAKRLNNVNYKLLTNKDGKYAWRPLQLLNPVIYVNLVNKITNEHNWKIIVKRFQKFQENKNINCYSIPLISKKNDRNDKAITIINWWQQIEQKSLELSLHFDCFMNTDITDCYGSIYTHTIPWALHGEKVIKNDFLNPSKPKIKYLGNEIDRRIQAMQFCQTNGIPQGSALMDFIAEIILGYADAKLSYKIKNYNRKESTNRIEDYHILRYRDDYRIFANNQQTLIKIAKLLTETLFELSFKLNSQKTYLSDNIVKDVVKPDKLYWNEAKQGEKSLQKHLFLIHNLAEKHPNSGSLTTALVKFLEERVYPIKLFKEENSKVLVSILVDIAFKNPRTYPVITAILSKILSLEINKEIVDEIFDAIENKFDKIPNVGHLQVWLQRLTIKIDRNKNYTEKLCKKVVNDNSNIWNIEWISNSKTKDAFSENSIIDEGKIDEMEQVIEPKEIKIFGY